MPKHNGDQRQGYRRQARRRRQVQAERQQHRPLDFIREGVGRGGRQGTWGRGEGTVGGLPSFEKGFSILKRQPFTIPRLLQAGAGYRLGVVAGRTESGKRRRGISLFGLLGLGKGKRGDFVGTGRAGKPFGGREFREARRGGHPHGGAEHAERKFQQPFGIKQGGHMAFGQERSQSGGSEKGQLRHGGPNDACGETAAEYIWAYPPGVPLVAPGETITPEFLASCRELEAAGTRLHHSRCKDATCIAVL